MKHSFKILITTCSAAALFCSCSKDPEEQTPQSDASKATMNRQETMDAYYDDMLFTVNMEELGPQATQALLNHNNSINEIYAYDDLDEPQDFIPVIDAIPGEQGYNPLWEQFLIEFNPGFTEHQFTNEEDIEDAAAGPNPEITLVPTNEIYRCSVIGGPN
jgi:hypothetical protein